MKSKLIYVLLFLSNLVYGSSAIHETHTMDAVEAQAEKMAHLYGPQSVLLAFDIDSTLLSLKQDIGSDYWFSWQAAKIKNEDTEHRVAQTLPELFRLQHIFYQISQIHPPEPGIPSMIERLQKRGFPMIALTSRMTDFRDITLQQLGDIGVNLTRTAPSKCRSENFVPYDIQNPEHSGLSHEDIRTAGAKNVWPVNYCNGIYLSAGLHKGLVLKSFIHSLRKLKGIIFVDDRPYHAENVAKVFEKTAIDAHAFRYGKEDHRWKSFETSQVEAVQDYKLFMELKKNVFE